MSVNWTLVLLFAATISCDVVGQLCFKIGAERLPAYHGPSRTEFFRGLFGEGWLLAGIAAYVAQLIVWVLILSMVPISVAFPVAALTFLGVAAVGRLVLNERLDRPQRVGALLVAGGVAIVAGAA